MSTRPVPGDLKALIRDIPDFPKPGILFRDLTPLMGHGQAFRETIERLASAPPACGHGRDGHRVARLHLRRRGGRAAGPGLRAPAQARQAPPPHRKSVYDLEYGSDGIEIHEDAVPRDRAWR
jgi:adenine phosphoribosyltransferase